MEDYVKKHNYLNHLKQISAIKNGHCKSGITNQKPRLSSLNINLLKQNVSNLSHTLSKFSTTKRNNPTLTNRSFGNFGSKSKSTEQIMKNFSIQKQNLRLVERLGTISSQINMRKYEKQYDQSKKLMKIHSKIKKPKEYFKFKIYDIKFQQHVIDPDQIFTLYQMSKNKKKIITQGTVFQLRKQEIKTTKNQTHIVKIQGRGWGTVQLTMKSLLPIKRNKQQVGNLIIDII